jgi:hypothetical protein
LVKGGHHVVHPDEGNNDIHARILAEQVLDVQNVIPGSRAIAADVSDPYSSPVNRPAEIHFEEVRPDLRIIERATQGRAAPNGEDAVFGAVVSKGPSPHAEAIDSEVRHPLHPVDDVRRGGQGPLRPRRVREVAAGTRPNSPKDEFGRAERHDERRGSERQVGKALGGVNVFRVRDAVGGVKLDT